jgi:hypothetical protein
MVNVKRVIRMVGLALAASCGVEAVMAQGTYTVDPYGVEDFNASIDGQSGLAFAGSMWFNLVSGSGGSFAAICTDVSGTLYFGYNYSFSAPTPFAGNYGLDPTWGAGNASGLVNKANAVAAINAAANLFSQYGSILSNPSTSQTVLDEKAGLQLAVWAALYNTAAGATSVALDGSRFNGVSASSQTYSGGWGQTYAGTSAAIADAESDLAHINFSATYTGDLLTPTPTTQYGLTAQDVIVSVTPVPEPSTLIAGGMLLLPFAASTLRSWNRRIMVAGPVA